MPTTHQIEFIGEAVEYLAFSTEISDRLGWLPISDSDVEVTTEYEIGAAPKRGDEIKNMLHRAYISALTGRPVNAEYY